MKSPYATGSDLECVYALMTFGIPADILPINAAGDRRPEAHRDFCKKLKIFPTMKDNIERIVIPSTYDVLFGRGKPLQKHPGNLRYHHIVDSHQAEYEAMQKLAKTNLSKQIVEMFKQGGDRFLKQDEGGWLEVDDESARYKVSHSFRNHRIAARTHERKCVDGKHSRKTDCVSSMHLDEMSASSSIHSDGEGSKRRRLSDLTFLSPSIL